MPEKVTGRFLSANEKTKITYYVWAPEKPRAIIQLSHGMCEYVERYAPHAEFFCSQGFVFAGNDHLGHGNTAESDSELGYTHGAEYMIKDLAAMTDILRERYPDLPIFLLGHSMGSFLLRGYMTRYREKIDGAIISGTAGPENPTALGGALASIIAFFRGDHHRSKLLYSMSTGSYAKAFGKDAPAEAWLTHDETVMRAYAADKFCNYTFTANGYISMFDILGEVSKKDWAKKVDPSLPILMISGKEDPVGNFGRGVEKIHERLRDAGMCDLTLALLDSARHEPFNETEPTKSEAYKTVTDWINKRT